MSADKRCQPGHARILHWLGARTGLSFRETQLSGAVAGIGRVMRQAGMTDLEEFARLLEFDVDVLEDLIVELTVGETYFFREPSQFEYIRREILPEIRQRRGLGHVVRMWSAACASGEEPYSLAILCDQEGLSQVTEIMASDISAEALSKAREASYSPWSLRGEGAVTAKEYLRFDGVRYHLDERICRRVRFEFLNLALAMYPDFANRTMGLDLILCRNVLIYFDRETIGRVVRRLYDCLADHGWLISGSGDPPVDQFAPFQVVISDYGVFYRKDTSSESRTISLAPGRRLAEIQAETDVDSPPQVVEKKFSVPKSSAPGLSTPSPPLAADPYSQAAAALSAGEYRQAAEVTGNSLSDPAACVLHIKALANLDTQLALRKCRELTQRHSLSPELHYLNAVLLIECNLDVEAIQAVQRAIYLDGSLAIAHFTMGALLQRRGALEGALRSFRNTRNLCEAMLATQAVPLSEGETAGSLAAAAESQLAAIEAH